MSQINFGICIFSLKRTPDIPHEKTGLSELSAATSIKIDFEKMLKLGQFYHLAPG